MCGAAFLNFRFEEHIKPRIGENTFARIKSKPKAWQVGLKNFEEYLKRNVNESAEEDFNVPLPGLPDNAAVSKCISNNTSITDGPHRGHRWWVPDVVYRRSREIFEPVVKEVIRLIEGQIDTVRASGETASVILLGRRASNHFENVSLI